MLAISEPLTYQDTSCVGALPVADNRISWEVLPGSSKYTSSVRGLVIFIPALPDLEGSSNELLPLKIFSKLFENPTRQLYGRLQIQLENYRDA